MAWIENVYLYFRKFRRYDSYQTRKKLFLILIILTVLFIFRSPSLFRFAKQKTSFFLSANKRCVEQGINEVLYGKDSFDYSVKRDYDYDYDHDKMHLPYVGNGRLGIGISEDGQQSFYIKNSRSLDLMFPFYPLINVDTLNSDYQRASAVEFENGVVYRFTCMTVNNKQSFNIQEKFYAHRLISSLFVQEFKINNPTNQPLVLHLRRGGWQGDQDISIETVYINSITKYEYTFHSGLYAKYPSSDYLAFAIAAPIIPDFVEIKPRNTVNLMFYTFMNYTALSSKNNLSSNLAKLKLELKEIAIKTHSPVTKKGIYTNHKSAWRNLWKSGIGLSLSKAENVLNGDVINATIYYILSQKTYFAQDLDVIKPAVFGELTKANKLIEEPASCYDGHSTFQASSLWSKLETVDEINKVVNLWLMTLDKQGCHNLIASGAEGTMQALILSMVPLQFTQHHIEFNTHPKDLHRDYYIRRLRYGKNTSLNLTVLVSEKDNRASIYVAIDRKDEDHKLLACDAGCLDNPVTLNTLYTVFPVKLTEPLTPILYITADKKHIEELKHTIHVKEISPAPAHEDHVIAMHRHGHSLSTLAALFWLTVVFLIVMFHVFLFRIIYNEYFLNNYSNSYEKVKKFYRISVSMICRWKRSLWSAKTLIEKKF